MLSPWKKLDITFDRLEKDISTDTLIIGGGLAGLLCAFMLERDGVDYALVEAGRIACGVTRNTTAKLTSQHGLIYSRLTREFGADAAGLYLRANEEALDEYRTLCRNIDCDFSERDNYVYSLYDSSMIDSEMNALKALGFPAARVSSLPLPFPVAGAVRFPRQAQFEPMRFIEGIAKGLHIYENTKVTELKGLTAVTQRGKIRAKKLIVATHFPFINKHGAYFLKLYQHRSYVVALKNAPVYEGMYVDESDSGLSFRAYGDMLLLGGGGKRTGCACGGWRELEAFAAEHYPDAKVECRWATQDCMTLDGAPYIGRYSPRTENFYVATGFNKWGMTSSMVAATMLAKMSQGRESPYEALFDPSRSMLRPQLALNALHAAASLVTPTLKRCPHLGCALKHNKHENTWDCPCHGSRFTLDGKLLNEPSTGDTEL